MSSFQDNFKRDAGGEDDELEYDDSAFYFFSLALLTFIVVPLTLNTLFDPIYVSSIVSVSMLPLQGGRIRMQERVHIVRLFR